MCTLVMLTANTSSAYALHIISICFSDAPCQHIITICFTHAHHMLASGAGESEQVRRLISLLDQCNHQLFSWENHGRDVVDSDVDDIRSHHVIMTDGITCLETLHLLYMQADQVRREQLLTKFYLQLSTYASDRVPELEAPFNEELADDYITLLEEEDAAFIVCSARAGNPIVSCSSGFTELTGYTKEEVQWLALSLPLPLAHSAYSLSHFALSLSDAHSALSLSALTHSAVTILAYPVQTLCKSDRVTIRAIRVYDNQSTVCGSDSVTIKAPALVGWSVDTRMVSRSKAKTRGCCKARLPATL